MNTKHASDMGKDLLPISVLVTTPIILVVNPAVNARTVQELIALANAQPGKLAYASGGTGNVQHLSAELFRQEAKIDLLHVPGISAEIWYGLLAPSRTPSGVVERIGRSAVEVARMPDVKEKLVRSGAEPVGSTPARFAAFYKSEREKWRTVGRNANIRLESEQ